MRIDVNTRFGISASSELVTGSAAINESILNILRCPLGSRAFHPEYGCLLPKLLWEPCDNLTAQLIKVSVFKAISKLEPDVRLDLSNSKVVPLANQDGFQVVISYTDLISSNSGQANFVFVR